MDPLLASLISLPVGVTAGCLWTAYRRHPLPAASSAQIERPSAWRKAAQTIRVGTYNIHGGKGTDGRRDLRRIAAKLEPADVVALQEVTRPLFGSNGRNDAQELARHLDMGWVFLPGQSRFHTPCYGNGLLSRFEVSSWYREPLVDTCGEKFRTLTIAAVALGDEACPVMVTHVSKRQDQDVQLRRILKNFMQHDRAILMGDFNATRNHPLLREAIDSGEAHDAIATIAGKADTDERIDWILTRGFSVEDGGVVDTVASNHPYYWTDLAIPVAVPSRVRPVTRTQPELAEASR